MLSLLSHPSVYVWSQSLLGGTRARLIALTEFRTTNSPLRILDIGCGPGYLSQYFPTSEYLGFDINAKYVQYANRTYGPRAKFFCQEISRSVVDELGSFDLVIMGGLIHHLNDSEALDL